MRLWLGLGLLGLLALAAILAPFAQDWLGHDPFTPDLFKRHVGASPEHPLGTDELGRDLLLRLLFGARVSLSVGLATAIAAALLGTAIGVLAAWRGGVVDALLMRLADGMLALPALPVLVVLAAADTGRIGLPRGEALSVLSRDYVRAARALGASEARVLLRHVLPNIAGPVAVATALAVAGAILAESTLSFLGLGIAPPAASWGNMLSNAQDLVFSAPWAAVWPGLAILLAVAGCTLVADGLASRR